MTIGIDLGTSTCEAAIIRNGRPEIVKNLDGARITPSYVGLDENGGFIAGQRAADQFLLHPDRTAMEIKRLIGTSQKIRLGDADYTPVELSAKLLEYIRDSARETLGEAVDSAVITVPAYFGERQRRETVLAGQMAGLVVERIINEPTAAALCYGIDHLEDESVILVCDFGGGTFDVTVMELFSGVLEVKATDGINQLGGKDMDERVINWLIERFKKREGVDLREDPYAMVRLKAAAEECKIALSAQDSFKINLPLLTEKNGRPLSLDETLTRDAFEEMIGDLVKKTAAPIENAIRESGFSRERIDMVLLVGGTTRVPLVKRYIETLLGKEAGVLVDPDLAVAMGAAIQADLIDGAAKDTDMVITDVCPFSLGVRAILLDDKFVEREAMSVIIPRNTTIPVTRRETYCTFSDYQTVADILVYQGESESLSENRLIGKFQIHDIPPRKTGEESLLVSFSYDVNGLLDVECEIFSTGKKASITIDVTGVSSDEPCEKRDVSAWKDAKDSLRYRSVVRRAEKLAANGETDEEARRDIEDAVYALKRALLDNESRNTLDELEDILLGIIEDFEP